MKLSADKSKRQRRLEAMKLQDFCAVLNRKIESKFSLIRAENAYMNLMIDRIESEVRAGSRRKAWVTRRLSRAIAIFLAVALLSGCAAPTPAAKTPLPIGIEQVRKVKQQSTIAPQNVSVTVLPQPQYQLYHFGFMSDQECNQQLQYSPDLVHWLAVTNYHCSVGTNVFEAWVLELPQQFWRLAATP